MHELHESAFQWETSRIFTIEKSERRAWIIAFCALGVTILSWIAIVCMLPLKETVPYVIRVDNTTGVPDIVTTLTDKKISSDDVMNKYWLAQYVRTRETYDWYSLQKDYTMVGLLSSKSVGEEYAQLFNGQHALDKQFKNDVRSTVEIISVVPNEKNTGTVRFIKTSKRVDQPGPGISTKWVATVAYEFQAATDMKESERLINPFGFQVLTYRVDPEMVGDAS